MENRRKNSRIDIKIDTEIVLQEGGVYSGQTRNISFGGMMVELNENPQFETNAECRATLVLQKENRITIEFVCYVKYLKENQVGMKFIEIDGVGSYEHFKNMMIGNCPDPDELVRELEKSPGIIK